MQAHTSSEAIINILALAMVLFALGISAVGPLRHMIHFYRWQSMTLGMLTLLVALSSYLEAKDIWTLVWLGMFACLIPFGLAYVIEPLLMEATVRQELSWSERFRVFVRLTLRPLALARSLTMASLSLLMEPPLPPRPVSAETFEQSLATWLEHSLSPRRQVISLVVGFFLITSAYLIAISIIGPLSKSSGLGASIALLLLGIFTMINREDLISQIMGLLVMDHGLFLAVVVIVDFAALLPFFIGSLFLYILITLLVLVILLPELHARSQTIEVADQNELRG